MSKKIERGTKRVCGECSLKFYDLNRDPIICPHCETVYQIVVPQAKPVAKKVVEPLVKEKPAAESEEGSSASMVPDITADAENVGAGDETDLAVLEDGEELVDISDDDDSFLETDEDSNTDMSTLVSGPAPKDSGE